jgi:hypothetical protein
VKTLIVFLLATAAFTPIAFVLEGIAMGQITY